MAALWQPFLEVFYLQESTFNIEQLSQRHLLIVVFLVVLS